MPNEKRRGMCYLCSLAGVLPVFASEPYLEECAAEVAAISGALQEPPVLVHGWPTLAAGPHKGSIFGHAWVEWPRAGLVWDHLTGNVIVLPVYYRAGKIDPKLCHGYSAETAGERVDEHGHAGPWVEEPPGAL